MKNKTHPFYLFLVLIALTSLTVSGQNNLSLSGSATASSAEGSHRADMAIDDKLSFWRQQGR